MMSFEKAHMRDGYALRHLAILILALGVACGPSTDGGDVEAGGDTEGSTQSGLGEGGSDGQTRVEVPGVVGDRLVEAKAALREAGLRVNVTERASSTSPGTVLSQKPAAGSQVREGRTIRLVVAKPPPPDTTDEGGGQNCTPGYTPCLPPASDYDCAGGTGDGPKYVSGPVTVTGSDPYGLDADGDGIGCET